MKKIIVLCLAIACSAQVFSQKNYKRAIIYTTSGDSIVCYVKDKEWLTNPSAFSIKKTQEAKPELLNTRDIARVTIEEGDRYVAANVKVDITPSEFQTPFVDPSLIKSEEVFVFLLSEYIGKSFSLYSLRKNGRLHLYLQKEQGAYEELIYRDLTLLKDGTNFQTEDKAYIAQLTEAFAGCSKAVDKSKTGNYSLDNIISILKIYDGQCGHQVWLYANDKRRKGTLSIILLAGVSMNKTSFSHNGGGPFYSDNLLTTNPLKTDPSFAAGVRFSLTSPRRHQKMSFLLDLCYHRYKATVTEYKNYVSGSFYDRETLNIQPSLIRVTPMVRYYFFQQPLRLFIQGGFVFSYVLSHKDEAILEEYLNGQTTSYTADPYSNSGYEKTQFGYTVGGGIAYKRFSVDYKFEQTTGFANTLSIKSSITMNNVLLGFRIGK